MSPAPTAATFHPLHVVTTNAAGICILGDNTALTTDASTLIFSNVSYISITGIDGTSDFRIKPEFVYTEEVTEFVDNNGNLIYVDGNGNQVPLPPNERIPVPPRLRHRRQLRRHAGYLHGDRRSLPVRL